MKIIFLNAWNGKVKGIIKFIEDQRGSTDIFCFQETHDEMKLLCKGMLSNFEEIPAYKYVDVEDDFLQAIYTSKNVKVLSSEVLFEGQMDCGLGIYIQVEFENTKVHICNFHGLSKPGDKLDNFGRLKQSKMMIDFFKDKEGLKIIGGDFNLLPETESIEMFEKYGYRDLIKDFKISTTRNRLAWENYPDNKQYYSDYVFVSQEVKVNNFSVPNIEISDHLPLILDIEL